LAEATAIAARAHEAGIRVVNSPQALSNTVKSVQARIWTDTGITTPSHTVFDSKEELLTQADELDYPLILKSDEFHRQKGMCRCGDASEVCKALLSNKLKAPIAAASFVDTRRGYATERPGSLWAEYYHKKRSVVLGEIVRSRHVLFSRDPIVSLRTCTLNAYKPRKPKQAGKSPLPFIRRFLGVGDSLSRDPLARQSVAEDNAFFFSSPEEPTLLRRACQVLGLEVASIDYSVQASGELVLWEANSFCTMETPEGFVLRKERRYSERRRRTFEDLTGFFSGLLNEANSRKERAEVGSA
jgi:hypothetical protein